MRCDSLTCVKEKSYINNILNLLINAQFDYMPLLNKRPLKRPRRLFEKMHYLCPSLALRIDV